MPIEQCWSKSIKEDFGKRRLRFSPGNIELWRYMTLPRLSQFIAGDVWFPSILSLRSMNDPFEGEGMVMPDRVDQAVRKQDKLMRQLEADGVDGEPLEVGFAEGFDLRASDLSIRFLDRSAKARCAWCWFSSQHESRAMWENYGKMGVVVKTTAERLMKALPEDREFLIGDVRYIEPRPAHDESTMMLDIDELEPIVLRPYLLKRLEYRDEHEIRVVSRCGFGVKGESIKLSSPERLIQSITVYPTADETLFDGIRNSVVAILKAKFPGIDALPAIPDSVPIAGNPIEIEASSMQSALYRKNASAKNLNETLEKIFRKLDDFPI